MIPIPKFTVNGRDVEWRFCSRCGSEMEWSADPRFDIETGAYAGIDLWVCRDWKRGAHGDHDTFRPGYGPVQGFAEAYR